MKFEDLKLVQKWREYAGPKDERLEAESAKIYKIGFVLLSFGWQSKTKDRNHSKCKIFGKGQ